MQANHAKGFEQVSIGSSAAGRPRMWLVVVIVALVAAVASQAQSTRFEADQYIDALGKTLALDAL